jgi:imidazolonepropionase-like amidohydrolase
MVEAGMPVMEAIQSATVHAAELLRVENELGQIAPGFHADIVAFDANPLDDVSVLERPSFVMKAGAVFRHDKGR